MIVCDESTWEPAKTDDPAASVLAGEQLYAEMFGHKLRGRLVLILRGPPAPPGGAARERWLLSVRSGRTNDDVAAGRGRGA